MARPPRAYIHQISFLSGVAVTAGVFLLFLGKLWFGVALIVVAAIATVAGLRDRWN